MKRALAAALIAASCAAHAGTVKLGGEYGCDLLSDQLDRLDLMRDSMATAELRARGAATQESEATSHRAAAAIVEISRTRCQALTGTFKVLERRAIAGGHALRVQAGSRELWILE